MVLARSEFDEVSLRRHEPTMVSIKLISNKEANMIEKIVNGELEYLYSRLIQTMASLSVGNDERYGRTALPMQLTRQISYTGLQ